MLVNMFMIHILFFSFLGLFLNVVGFDSAV